MNFNGLIKSFEMANSVGDFEKALHILLKALNLQPNNISILNKIAEINLNLTKYTKSLIYLRRAAFLDERNSIIQRKLRIVYLKLKD